VPDPPPGFAPGGTFIDEAVRMASLLVLLHFLWRGPALARTTRRELIGESGPHVAVFERLVDCELPVAPVAAIVSPDRSLGCLPRPMTRHHDVSLWHHCL